MSASSSQLSTPPPNIFETMQTQVLFPALATLAETIRLFPDSLMFGSIFLYLLTSNTVFGIFSLFLFETTSLHSLVAWTFKQVYGPSVSPSTRSLMCETGFHTTRLEVERIFPSNNWPSRNIFSLYAVAAYLFSSTMYFQDTLKQMGPEWVPRASFAYSFIIILTIAITLSRWCIGCERLVDIAVSVLFGLIVGILLFAVNKAIFGPEAVNFLGLPYLVDKAQTGSDIYVCAPSAPLQAAASQ